MDDTILFIFWFVIYLYFFEKQININKTKNFFIGFLFLFLISPISYASVSIINENKRTDYPGKQIAEKVQKLWNKDFEDEITVVLGNEWNAGNLSYHLKSRPRWKGEIDNSKVEDLNKFICIDEICIGN